MRKTWLVFTLLFTAGLCAEDCLEKEKLRSIRSDHVYFQLKHPCVIGHMGNVQEFQENTLEGIRSLIEIKADGVHLHVQLTEDDQLVLFQDRNLYRMTGEDFELTKLPYNELLKMDLMDKISYYKHEGDYTDAIKTFTYRSTSKIPLLSDALKELKATNLLVYIELMPENVGEQPIDRYIALRVGELATKLIQKLQMERQVLIVSRDPVKLVGVNSVYGGISFGWLIDPSLYEKKTAETMKVKFNDIPRVFSLKTNCLNKTGANGFSFTKYLISTGYISKAVNSSFVDFAIDIFNQKLFYEIPGHSSLREVVSKNYGRGTTVGTFDVFTVNDTTTSTEKEDVALMETIDEYGVTRIVTDDVNRVKRALHQKTITYNKGSVLQSYFQILLMVLVFSKTLATLIFV
eukprot:TCONS_00034069-protein